VLLGQGNVALAGGVGGAQFGLTNYMGAWDAQSEEAQRQTTATIHGRISRTRWMTEKELSRSAAESGYTTALKAATGFALGGLSAKTRIS